MLTEHVFIWQTLIKLELEMLSQASQTSRTDCSPKYQRCSIPRSTGRRSHVQSITPSPWTAAAGSTPSEGRTTAGSALVPSKNSTTSTSWLSSSHWSRQNASASDAGHPSPLLLLKTVSCFRDQWMLCFSKRVMQGSVCRNCCVSSFHFALYVSRDHLRLGHGQYHAAGNGWQRGRRRRTETD